MFSKEDILKQLRNGAEPSVIAQQMADNINSALAEYEKEQEAAKKQTVQRADARKVIDALADYFGKYFDEKNMTEEEKDAAVDAIIQLTDHMKDLEDKIDAAFSKIEKSDGIKKTLTTTDEDVIRKFLSSL